MTNDHDMWFIYVFAPILVALGGAMIKGIFSGVTNLSRMVSAQETVSKQVTEMRSELRHIRESMIRLGDKLEHQQEQINMQADGLSRLNDRVDRIERRD